MSKLETSMEFNVLLAVATFLSYGTLSFLIGSGSNQFEDGFWQYVPYMVWCLMSYPCGIALGKFLGNAARIDMREKDGEDPPDN